MKATIKRPDGTTISVDGATAEDLLRLAGGTTNAPAPHVCAPCQRLHFDGWPFTLPAAPVSPFLWPPGQPDPYRYYVGDRIDIAGPVTCSVSGAVDGAVLSATLGRVSSSIASHARA